MYPGIVIPKSVMEPERFQRMREKLPIVRTESKRLMKRLTARLVIERTSSVIRWSGLSGSFPLSRSR